MIEFTSLRLNGFKSFVDRSELEIGTGLNGIVGPNGCGKSNLVEALRWVMGESSAKRMRGSGMEDVIFAGTDKRSSRNIAEVSLLLNNSSRTAPAAYNNSDEIEVTRKIERDKGSGYRINGKHARARDVQMLFADTVTGANSPSLVSQGHVTRMINAKPQDRRLILEESAGIAGLYARRHEAELRLKAADTNLLRVDDILVSMESRLNSIKRQARQASKYKNLSAQIRQLEIVATYLEWQSVLQKQKSINSDFSAAESIVAENLGTVTQLTKTQNTQVEELPPLRKQESELGASLQKHRLDLQRLEEEEKRHSNDMQETKTQLHQTNIDKQHEEQTLEEIASNLENAESENTALQSEQNSDTDTHKTKLEAKDSLNIKVIELEERFTALKESAAEGRAREASLTKQIERNKNNMNILIGRKDNALSRLDGLVIDNNSQKTIKELEVKTNKLEVHLQNIKGKTDDARSNITSKEENTEISRNNLSEIENRYTGFLAEISMLEKLFNSDDSEFTPVLDSIITKSGFEKALSRALGSSLMASIDSDAPSNWNKTDSNNTQELPKGAKALLPYIDAPEELHLALSQIGFVEDAQLGEKLAPSLKTGQSLVSADGEYWRWDGYHVQVHATDRHSLHLEQKNKLIELQSQRDEIQEQLAQAKGSMEQDLEALNKAKNSYSDLLADIKTTEGKLKELRPAMQKIKDKNLSIASEKKRFEEQIITLDEDLSALNETLDKDKIALDILLESQNDGQHSDDIISEVKEQLDHTKSEYQEAVRSFDMLEQAQNTRRARMQAIADERISLKNRSIRSSQQLTKLQERSEVLTEKLSDLQSQPINKKSGHEDMLSLISQIDDKRSSAAERLAACEAEITETNKALKEAENILGTAREKRAGAQAMLAATNEQLSAIELAIKEKFDIEPNHLVNHAAVDLVKYQISDLPKIKQEKESLTRERDSIGAVNLRAEDEAAELEAELTTLLHEKNDLMQAIDELRGAINKINKEARERLKIAFDLVNVHFQRLFVRLFGGGKAYLELIESDDPLGSGLEIFAQPPGKALQSLSLLSGGEQTLTSIALIFGMFLTNPSPICVLDEIDAPLDDANVDRVCNLLDEIAARGETRFLVITHHRLSMARMDRLYGVTMSEKGVSQLVSVDLQQSFEFTDKKVA